MAGCCFRQPYSVRSFEEPRRAGMHLFLLNQAFLRQLILNFGNYSLNNEDENLFSAAKLSYWKL